MARKLTIEFIGDSKSLEKSFGNIGKGADNTGGKLDKVKGPAKAAGLALGVGLAGALKVGFDEMAESQKVMGQTNAVLKSTGSVANVTAGHVGTLAGALSKKSGVDDEAIQSGENMLLTFKDIRNETGKGNKVFDEATKAALDMSVAMGTDVKSASMTVGKALNDPLKGLTKLTKQGVTFTDAQKKQVEAMVKSGDTMGAQKILLKELNSEFGGSAKAAGDTFPGSLAKLKNSFEEVAGTLIQMLMPAFQALAAIFATVGAYLQEHPEKAKVLGIAIGILAGAFLAVAAATKIAQVATTIWSGVTKVAAAAQWLFNAAMSANPIALVVIAIAALAAGFYIAYQKSETFRAIVDKVWEVIKTVTGAVWNFITSLTDLPGKLWEAGKAITNGVIDGIKALPGLLVDAATWLWNKVKAGLEAYLGAYKAVGGWVLSKIIDGFKVVTELLASVGGWIFEKVKGFIHAEIEGVKAIGGWVINRIVDGFKATVGLLATIGGWVKNRVKETIELAIEGFKSIGGWVVNRIVDGLKDTVAGLATVGGWLKNRLVESLNAAKDAFMGLGSKVVDWIVDGLKGGLRAIGGFAKSILKIIGKIPGLGGVTDKGIEGIDKLIDGKKKGGMFGATGGYVNKPMLLAGEEAPKFPEYVIPTNPAYRGRAKGLLGKAADAIGLRGGGVFSQKAMENLWAKHGGGDVQIAGAVGMAESGGNPNAGQDHPYHGLWQVGPGGPFDPDQNAIAAIKKWRAGGSSVDARWKPWEAYTGKDGVGSDGPFRQFMGGGTSLNPLDFIKDLPGLDDLPEWLKDTGKWVLNHVKDWIKDKIASLASVFLPGGGEGGPGGVGMYQGLAMAEWIIGALKHARSKHNFQGQATSGYRTQAEQDAIRARDPRAAKVSQHTGTHWPAGAVDFGGFDSGLATKMAAVAATADYKYPLLAPIGFHDDGHASGSGHRKGGILGQGEPFVGSYAHGGIVPEDGMAYVHKGESISPAGREVVVDVSFADGMEWLKKYMSIQISERERTIGRAYRAGVA